MFKYDVESVNYARDEAQQRKHDTQPEVALEAHLQKYAEWWQDNRKDHLNWVCHCKCHDRSLLPSRMLDSSFVITT